MASDLEQPPARVGLTLYSPLEAATHSYKGGAPPAAVAALPPSRGWVALDCFVRRRDDDSFPADDPTVASLTNSRGDPFDVCVSLNAPPQPSTLYLRWPNGPAEGEPLAPVAAHDGAVLLLMHYPIPVLGDSLYPMIDYFVYSADSGARPSLRWLPPLGGTIGDILARVQAEGFHATNQMLRRMESLDIGIVRRGLEEFVVAELQMTVIGETARPELTVFNPSISDQWVLKRPRVVPVRPNGNLDLEHILWYWDTDKVVAFGSWMCWVDYSSGVMLCNVFDEAPEILFLELPPRLYHMKRHDHVEGGLEAYHTLGTTDGGNALKFAFVLWYDGMLKRTCDPDPSNFSITTWKLRIQGNDMVWVEDSWLAAYDLWPHDDDFAHIPRDLLLFPMFSMDDPNEVTFLLKHKPSEQEDGTYDNAQIWLVSIDMIKKKLKSSILYVENQEDSAPEEAELFERKDWLLEPFLPMKLPKDPSSFNNSVRSQGVASGCRVSQ
ncbi:hypothetical protein SEVIR_3G364500v4 [Setaria viridis]|uniref:DUF1618 domain-containing protein n=1 Tax=Setaria viridis TaxID=4556 RepID=A0A4U6VMQ5_SETVI|nr:uncharacterized protein LOC117847902 isoform X1 [Setaria viridis]TKW28969.1 hypothetical protein SEVIR_3G364500v2 [Setaria viridis]